MKIGKHETHPAADLFPMLVGVDLAALTESVRANGLRQPITLAEERVLDGRNRLRACLAAGVEPRFVDFAGDNPWQYVWDLNAERRHLEPFQKAALAVKFAASSGEWRRERERKRTDANASRAMAADARRGPGGKLTSAPSVEGGQDTRSATAKDIAAKSKVSR